MWSLDVVAGVGGSVVLLTYAVLMCYLRGLDDAKNKLIVGPFQHFLHCWTVLCFLSAAASVALYIEISQAPHPATVWSLGVFLLSAASWVPLTILDVEVRSAGTVCLIGICMLVTSCAWLFLLTTGPSPNFVSCALFAWTFSHHVVFDSWLWYAIYLDNRSGRVGRLPPV